MKLRKGGKVTAKRKFADGGNVSNFGKAWRAARKSGDDTFTFGGKSYTTQTREEKAAADASKATAADLKPTPAPAAKKSPPDFGTIPEITVTGKRTSTPTPPPPPSDTSTRGKIASGLSKALTPSGSSQADDDAKASAREDAISGAIKKATDFVTKGTGKGPSFRSAMHSAVSDDPMDSDNGSGGMRRGGKVRGKAKGKSKAKPVARRRKKYV
jgi:hypothetical protein